jgi:seryl-tRNA synthetase
MSLQLLDYDLHVHQELVQSQEAEKIKGKIVVIMFPDAIQFQQAFIKLVCKLIRQQGGNISFFLRGRRKYKLT